MMEDTEDREGKRGGEEGGEDGEERREEEIKAPHSHYRDNAEANSGRGAP